ncbi:excisionase [Caloramator australicus]|uniref:DNA binding protein, excisionase family n=1 Tax=Caloramator australicus RC3 TaxID=857293 RepID=I7K5R2_9CLOT|nr:excisionase [Caloramator australicus]CCJ32859.1 DNA binding protein, excisionase family [Caloramator australicus RC3]
MNKNIELKKVIVEAIEEALTKAVGERTKATLTIEECAKYSGIGRDKLRELAHAACNNKSDFPCFKVGNKVIINKNLFDMWLEKITQEKRVL